MAKSKLFVISIGGSLIAPDQIDTLYLKKIKKFILAETREGNRFILSPGGGKTCRRYQEALKKVSKTENDDLDWIGLTTNKLHAKFLQLMFKGFAHKEIASDPNIKLEFREKILIGSGGWKPGRSSDDFSVRLAKTYGADTVINLSNIDFAYDKDPKKFSSAQKIISASWPEFFKIIGTLWRPGANLPFDPTAGKFAFKNGIKVITAGGRNFGNLKKILRGKSFLGTTVG